MKKFAIALLLGLTLFSSTHDLHAQIKESSTNVFLIQSSRMVDLTADKAYAAFVNDFSKWYDASHSYSGKPENLSLDLKRHCMLEKLDDGGFVRHMEIVFHQPGKMFRMTGGLGPLQGMGVSGAMTFCLPGNRGQDEDRNEICGLRCRSQQTRQDRRPGQPGTKRTVGTV